MKFFLNFFDALQNRPSYKFFTNIFLLKNNQYNTIKQLNFIHIFYNIKKFFNIKLFKFNYFFYNTIFIYCFILNVISQVLLLLNIL